MSNPRHIARRRPSDSRQLRRQWALLRLLSASGRWYTVKELAEQLRCSKSTVERDLATLEGLFPLVEESAGAQKRRYRIDQTPREVEGVEPFGAMQLMALYVALGMMEPLVGTPFYDDLEDVVRIVRAHLAPRYNGGLDRLASLFCADHGERPSYADYADVVDDLVDGIAQRRVCEAVVRGQGARRIRPLKLTWRRDALHLVCRVEPAPDVQVIDIRELAELVVTREEFPPHRLPCRRARKRSAVDKARAS